MEFMVLGVVFVPLLLLPVILLLRQEKGQKRLIGVFSGVLFITAILIFIFPENALSVPIPSVIWKLITLAAVAVILFGSIRDKLYEIAGLAFIQACILIIMEITLSPEETIPFLQLQHGDKLLYLSGAFIFTGSLPLILCYLSRYFKKTQAPESSKKQSVAGLLLLMASFAGLLASNSLTGLFLFWQINYLANRLFHRSFPRHEKNTRIVGIIQQVALTLWLGFIPFIYQITQTLAINEISTGFFVFPGLFAMGFLTVIAMGVFIPEKSIIETVFSGPTPVTGLYAVILSLIAPLSVLLKLLPLFAGSHQVIRALVIVFGSLLMVAGAYYAGLFRKGGSILVCMVMFACGWGITNIFLDWENSVFYTAGFITVASITMAFLFSCITVLEYIKGTQNVEHMAGLLQEMPVLTTMLSSSMILFLFAPFYLALQRILFAQFMINYPLSMLLTITALAFIGAVLFRWLSVLITSRGKVEKSPCPPCFKIILPLFYLTAVCTNLMTVGFFDYFQNQVYPISVRLYGLESLVNIFKLGTGSIYLWGSLCVLAVVWVIIWRINRNKSGPVEKNTGVLHPYSLTSWIPATVQFSLWIRVGWVVTGILLVGVTISCL